MLSDRHRILELALESLENKKKQIDTEIAELTSELRSGPGRKASSPAPALKPAEVVRPGRKRSRFSKEERIRRSQRMKAYWDNWRKQKARQK
jgi:hypothetical protein